MGKKDTEKIRETNIRVSVSAIKQSLTFSPEISALKLNLIAWLPQMQLRYMKFLSQDV